MNGHKSVGIRAKDKMICLSCNCESKMEGNVLLLQIDAPMNYRDCPLIQAPHTAPPGDPQGWSSARHTRPSPAHSGQVTWKSVPNINQHVPVLYIPLDRPLPPPRPSNHLSLQHVQVTWSMTGLKFSAANRFTTMIICDHGLTAVAGNRRRSKRCETQITMTMRDYGW